jgi:hypothetical protein
MPMSRSSLWTMLGLQLNRKDEATTGATALSLGIWPVSRNLKVGARSNRKCHLAASGVGLAFALRHEHVLAYGAKAVILIEQPRGCTNPSET